jgi:hypothetical protein
MVAYSAAGGYLLVTYGMVRLPALLSDAPFDPSGKEQAADVPLSACVVLVFPLPRVLQVFLPWIPNPPSGPGTQSADSLRFPPPFFPFPFALFPSVSPCLALSACSHLRRSLLRRRRPYPHLHPRLRQPIFHLDSSYAVLLADRPRSVRGSRYPDDLPAQQEGRLHPGSSFSSACPCLREKEGQIVDRHFVLLMIASGSAITEDSSGPRKLTMELTSPTGPHLLASLQVRLCPSSRDFNSQNVELTRCSVCLSRILLGRRRFLPDCHVHRSGYRPHLPGLYDLPASIRLSSRGEEELN